MQLIYLRGDKNMGPVILIVLIVLVLYIAFRFFKASVGNSALRNEENKYLPDASDNEPDDGNDAADESGDAVDTSDSGGNDDGDNN